VQLLSRLSDALGQEKKQGRTQQFTFKNGIPIVSQKGSLDLTAEEIEALENYQAQSTASPKARTPVLPAVVPAHVALDKKVLLFNAYFKQTVHESPQEYYRVRIVKVCRLLKHHVFLTLAAVLLPRRRLDLGH
jgi:hypothetical protein